MSDLAKLKKKAADLEGKKQYEKALVIYQQVVDAQGDGEDVDLGLCNKVGDLLHRAGRTAEAVTYYDRAIEMYSARGFLNNAIAICNKVVRFSPGTVDVHHTLGRLSAQKGFRNDAKKHFLEYAEQMQRAGELDVAFAALKEFAELCPEHDDVRLTLADSLARHNRGTEALEQLDALHARYLRGGRHAEAEAARERMRAIDPAYEPRVPTGPAEPDSDVLLVFGEERRPNAGNGRGGSSAPGGGNAGLILIGPDAGVSARPAAPAPRLTPAARDVQFGREFELPPADAHNGPMDLADDAIVFDDDRHAGSDDERAIDGFEPTAAAEPERIHAAPPAQRAYTPAAPSVSSGSFTLDDITPTDWPDEHPASGATTAPHADESLTIDLELTGEVSPGAGWPVESRDEAGDEHPLVFESGAPYGGSHLDNALKVEPAPLDAAAMLGAEAIRRGPTPTVLDALGVGGQPAADGLTADPLADLPLMDGALATRELKDTRDQRSRNGSDDSAWAGAELPPLSDEADLQAEVDADSFGAPLLDTGWAPEAPARDSRQLAGRSAVWRRVSDALLAADDQAGALRELDLVLQGFESTGDMLAAGEVIDEIVRIAPTVQNHERRTDLAYRGDDQRSLRAAYTGLLAALEAAGQRVKAAGVRDRLAELDARPTRVVPPRAAEPTALVEVQGSFVNLGDLLRDDEPERTTRMVVEEQAPTGDEQADFAKMLEKFKRGLAENVDAEDFESHHDLGVAFREMGLLDEAIAEFQQALRGTKFRVRTLEALGQCFVEKEQHSLAAAVLQRAAQEVGAEDDQLVGVLYLLGVSLDAIGRRDEAVKLYERVLAVDYQFRDAADRVATAGRGAG